jgi:hypothetical protein
MPTFFWKKSLILQVEPPEEVVGIKTLGDIEFMSIKEFQGKVRQDDGTQIATGDVCSLTANVGKDMYLAKAKATVHNANVVSAVRIATVELSLNGVVVERWQPARVLFGSIESSWQADEYEFVTAVGRKVLAGEIIKLEVTFNGGSTFIVDGAIEVYEEDSGTNPQIAGTGGSGGGVGDIGYLALKQFENKLRTVEGTLGGAGILATITANPSKDMYLAGASLTWIKNIGSGTSNVQVELRVNGIVEETYVARATAANPGGFHPYHFNMRGLMVAAGQVIELVVTLLGTSSQIEGNIEVWEEDTGESPSDITGGGSVSGLAAGDVGFLALKSFGDKLFHELSATFTTTGVKITHIVPNGKTFYLYKAKILPLDGIILRISGGAGTSNDQCKADVNYDSTPIDRIVHDSQSTIGASLGNDSTNANLGGGLHTETGTVGLKLIGDGIKTVEIDVTVVNGSYKVLLEGWEEDTGTSPTA